MATEVRLPKLAASMDDGVISKWLVAPGSSVRQGDPLYEVESEKVTTEVESPADGVLQEILVPEGQKAAVGSVLAIIAAAGETPSTSHGVAVAAAAPATPQATAVLAPAPAATMLRPSGTPERQFVSPRARKIADERGVDLTRVIGSGPGGRIMEKDVLAATGPVSAPAPVAPAPARAPVVTAGPATIAAGRVIPLAGIRRAIAQRMVQSQQTVAEVTVTTEVDMGEAAKLRNQVGAEWQKAHNHGVSYTDVIVKAVAKALVEHPMLNSTLVEGAIHLQPVVNVGVGVALDDGLIVPVVRNADQKSLLEISETIRDLADRARRGAIKVEDVTSGTFTISNMGMVGAEIFTPIINPPECAILGIGRIAERAAVRDGQVVARPTMWLSLTFDHRIVDGVPAAKFLSRIKELLESPYLLFV